jgi:hypothetical protein
VALIRAPADRQATVLAAAGDPAQLVNEPLVPAGASGGVLVDEPGGVELPAEPLVEGEVAVPPQPAAPGTRRRGKRRRRSRRPPA